jgi:hypothetical protein
MANQWEDKGIVPDLFVDRFGGDTHRVEDRNTGEERFVEVYGSRALGEAIANRQFKKDD